MFAKLEGLEKKYMELEQQLSQPGIYNDQEQFKKLSKAHADLKDVVELFRQYRSAKEQIDIPSTRATLSITDIAFFIVISPLTTYLINYIF